MYGIGAFICHQLPERSFHLGGFQIPVCARCLGIYAGVALTACVQCCGALRVALGSAADAARPRRRGVLSPARCRRAVTFGARVERSCGAASNIVRAIAGVGAWHRRCARSDERGGYATLQLMRATTADRAQPAATAYLICAAAWLLPGLGHLWLGRRQKGVTFLDRADADVRIRACGSTARSSPFRLSEPLVALGALADLGVGLPYIIARATGAGGGAGGGDHLRVRQHVRDRRGTAQHARRARRLRHREGAQVTSHFGLMVIFAVFVSVVFATLMRDEPREQFAFGGRLLRRVRRRRHAHRLAAVSAAAVMRDPAFCISVL